jgi:copper chaperone CopZ
MSQLTLTVTGMTCGGCESAVTRALAMMEGVRTVTASHAANEVVVEFDPALATPEKIAERIEMLGYSARVA